MHAGPPPYLQNVARLGGAIDFLASTCAVAQSWSFTQTHVPPQGDPSAGRWSVLCYQLDPENCIILSGSNGAR